MPMVFFTPIGNCLIFPQTNGVFIHFFLKMHSMFFKNCVLNFLTKGECIDNYAIHIINHCFCHKLLPLLSSQSRKLKRYDKLRQESYRYLMNPLWFYNTFTVRKLILKHQAEGKL